MLEISWRPRAQLDRESIACYLAIDCKNPQAALKTIKELDDTLENARTFPEMGRRFQDDTLQNKDYRMLLCGSYRIFYRFDENQLTVYRILHQHRDIDTFTLIDF